MDEKEKLLQYINNPPQPTNARNRMGCSENWYDSFYAIAHTFTMDEIKSMSEQEIAHLIKLGDTIAEYLY